MNFDFLAAPVAISPDHPEYDLGSRTFIRPVIDIDGFTKYADAGRTAPLDVGGWTDKELNPDRVIYVVMEEAGRYEESRSGWIMMKPSDIARSGDHHAKVTFVSYLDRPDPANFLTFSRLYKISEAPVLASCFFAHVGSGDSPRID